jgi:hypothetical protein
MTPDRFIEVILRAFELGYHHGYLDKESGTNCLETGKELALKEHKDYLLRRKSP